jgi:hypothetical protein
MTLRNFLVIWKPELASVVTDIKVIDAFECPNVTNARMCMDAANAAGKYATPAAVLLPCLVAHSSRRAATASNRRRDAAHYFMARDTWITFGMELVRRSILRR